MIPRRFAEEFLFEVIAGEVGYQSLNYVPPVYSNFGPNLDHVPILPRKPTGDTFLRIGATKHFPTRVSRVIFGGTDNGYQIEWRGVVPFAAAGTLVPGPDSDEQLGFVRGSWIITFDLAQLPAAGTRVALGYEYNHSTDWYGKPGNYLTDQMNWRKTEDLDAAFGVTTDQMVAPADPWVRGAGI